MGENYSNKIREIATRQHRSIDNELLISKVQGCYNTVKRFVDKEIKKGRTVFEALDIVLNSKNITRICPQLLEQEVERRIRNIIISSYIAQHKGDYQQLKKETIDEAEYEER